jgi:hypothetical protein
MPDYYTVLAQKIQETRDDPVKIRSLALRWQVQEHWPGLSIIESKSHIRELEDAIARLEADAAGPGGRDSREPAAAGLNAGRGGRGSREPAKAAADLNASRQIRNATIESQKNDATFTVVRQVEDAIARLAGLKASRQSRNAPVESEEDDALNVNAESRRQPRGPPPVEPADLEAGAAAVNRPKLRRASMQAGKAAMRRSNPRGMTLPSGSRLLIRSPGMIHSQPSRPT